VRDAQHAEPVLLAPSWGQNHHSLQFQKQNSLAWHLQAAGYAVFLLSHRGVREAISPGTRGSWDFDDIVQLDLPAILDSVLERSDYSRVHWVGHGLGGQLLYGHLANEGPERIACGSTICAPVRFESPPTRAKALGLALRLLPGEMQLPTRGFGKIASPALSVDSPWMEQLGHRQTHGDMARGMLLHGTENLSSSLIQQVLTWTERGFLSDRHGHQDVAAALEGERTPLQIIATDGDHLCPPEAAFAIEDFWDGPVDRLRLDAGWGHQDPILAPEAKSTVFPRVEKWLGQNRSCLHQHATEAEEVASHHEREMSQPAHQLG